MSAGRQQEVLNPIPDSPHAISELDSSSLNLFLF